jgi:hypothetical protein
MMIFAAIALFMSVVTPAHASKVYWGDTEEIHKIQDLTMKDADGKPLFLAYRMHTKYIIAGVHIADLGYALGVEGRHVRPLLLTTNFPSIRTVPSNKDEQTVFLGRRDSRLPKGSQG